MPRVLSSRAASRRGSCGRDFELGELPANELPGELPANELLANELQPAPPTNEPQEQSCTAASVRVFPTRRER